MGPETLYWKEETRPGKLAVGLLIGVPDTMFYRKTTRRINSSPTTALGDWNQHVHDVKQIMGDDNTTGDGTVGGRLKKVINDEVPAGCLFTAAGRPINPH